MRSRQVPTHNRIAMVSALPAVLALAPGLTPQSPGPQPLRLEATIALPGVQGRIDHMSIDVSGKRLFVSALGNNTLEVIDLKQNQRAHSISGLSEPQGVLYVPEMNRIFVANRTDGTVHIFDGKSFAQLKVISYGSDADNVRYDSGSGHVYVGYGNGALGELDQEGRQIGESKLDAHPESFQLEKSGARIFVNLPDTRKLAVVDRHTRSIVGEWRTGGPLQNYPMALDERGHRLFIVCRLPARLIVFDTETGRRLATLPAAGDCDDLFFDAKRRRIYAIGGEGAVSIFQQGASDRYDDLARVTTRSGARTGFFSPDLDRLYVALRQHASEPAEIRVYAPQP